jgi:ribose-phosphate pyrophosphokinase
MITFYEKAEATAVFSQNRLNAARHNVFQFPGGESHVVLEPTSPVQIAFVQGADGNDLIALAMWADACRRHEDQLTTVLALPYLPGARMDRGTPLGAKVYADFINSLELDNVVCIDPHSDVAPALYDRLTVVPLTDLPIWDTFAAINKYDGVIIPDAGAIKRAEAVAAKLGVVTYQAGKKRDWKTGTLSGFQCENLSSGSYLVVDDICDGGGTFVGLADAIATQPHDIRLSLWVTHGIFSKGMDEILKRYTEVYNTNSHPGYENNPNRTGVNILPTLIDHVKGI